MSHNTVASKEIYALSSNDFGGLGNAIVSMNINQQIDLTSHNKGGEVQLIDNKDPKGWSSNSTPLTEFHLFTKLPTELRDMVMNFHIDTITEITLFVKRWVELAKAKNNPVSETDRMTALTCPRQ